MPPCRPALLAMLVAACVAARSSVALEWTAIARTGDPAIGLPGDPAITSLGVFERIGDAGEVVYGATTGPHLVIKPPIGGLYRWTDPATTLLVGYGDPSFDIEIPIRLAVNRLGDWVIADWPSEPAPGCDPGTSAAHAEKVVRSDAMGAPETLVEMGMPVPGAPDGLLYAGIARWASGPVGTRVPSSSPSLNLADSGALAFGAELAADPCSEDGRETILAVPPGGGLTLVALAGEPAPGLPDGFVLEELGLSPAALDDAGQVAFSATARSDTEVASAVYRWDPGSGVELVAMIQPPVLDSPRKYLPVELPAIAATGSIAWFGGTELFGPDGSGGTQEIFAVGDPVPGGPDGATFAEQSLGRIVPRRPWINGSDQVAFTADMTRLGDGDLPEPLGAAVFRADAGGPLELLVKTGDVAPYGGGATFGSPFTLLAFGDMGEVVFSNWLTSPDPNDPDPPDSAIYEIDAAGRLFPILLTDDLVALGAADSYGRTPASASLGFDAAFSRVAMSPGSFQGPDGVFVATIPEPDTHATATAALLALAAASLRTRRRPSRA